MSAISESTPESITDDILTFADDLDAAPPIHVRVSPPSDALPADRFNNVERQCRLRGGTPLFGRAIIAAGDLYLVGEFHCVVSTPRGLIDVTPSPIGATRTLFAEYPRLQDCAPQYRLTIRARVYGAAEKKAELEAKLLEATDADTASARKNGITVRQLLLSKLPRDPLAAEIDDYLRAEGKLESQVMAAHDGIQDWNPSRLGGLVVEFQRLDRRRRELYEVADRYLGFANGGSQFR